MKGRKKLFQILDWDSKHFGYKVARLNASRLTPSELKRVLSNLLKRDIRLVYWYINPKDKVSNKAAQENNGFLADEKTTYVKSVSPEAKNITLSNHIKSYLHQPLNDQLLYLTLEAGIYSRFKVDPNCKEGEFEILYTEWIKNSLNGKIAKDVLVYVEGGKEIGFITLGEKDERCNIGLIAVDEKFRGQGIGEQLMSEAFKKAWEWGYKEMSVVTQRTNRGACSFYEKLGSVVESTVNIYHFWLNGQKKTRILKDKNTIQ